MADFSFDDRDTDADDSGVIVAPFLAGNDGSGGDTDANGERFNPAIHSGRDKLNADGSYRKKRGRKAGSGAGTGSGSVGSKGSRKADSAASVESLARVLAVLHVGIATATKTPEMVLDDSEASLLANATANVLEQFDIRPDPKIEAIIGLIMAAGSIYGPRMYLISERKKADKVES
jgi:hypothetical protein